MEYARVGLLDRVVPRKRPLPLALLLFQFWCKFEAKSFLFVADVALPRQLFILVILVASLLDLLDLREGARAQSDRGEHAAFAIVRLFLFFPLVFLLLLWLYEATIVVVLLQAVDDVFKLVKLVITVKRNDAMGGVEVVLVVCNDVEGAVLVRAVLWVRATACICNQDQWIGSRGRRRLVPRETLESIEKLVSYPLATEWISRVRRLRGREFGRSPSSGMSFLDRRDPNLPIKLDSLLLWGTADSIFRKTNGTASIFERN